MQRTAVGLVGTPTYSQVCNRDTCELFDGINILADHIQ